MELFRFSVTNAPDVFSAALENAYRQTVLQRRPHDDDVLNAAMECDLPVATITENHYALVCHALDAQKAVIAPGFEHHPIRDCCGFCEPIALKGLQYFIGYSDSVHRPGIVCCTPSEYPKGNSKVKLPSGTKVTLPNGAYLVDASIFDKLMLNQTIYLI